MYLDAENEQGDRAPFAPCTTGNKINLRSRYFESAVKAVKARYKTAASVTAKTPRQDAAGIPRREAARSVIGQPTISKAAGQGGAASVSNVVAKHLQPTPGFAAALGAMAAVFNR